MKKLSRELRKKIEEKWVSESCKHSPLGAKLCFFIAPRYPSLDFCKYWQKGKNNKIILISDYFDEYDYDYDYEQEEVYLLRALTLNMFLDECEKGKWIK